MQNVRSSGDKLLGMKAKALAWRGSPPRSEAFGPRYAN